MAAYRDETGPVHSLHAAPRSGVRGGDESERADETPVPCKFFRLGVAEGR